MEVKRNKDIMSNKSNVTVIIPCYNDGDFIKQALDSILSQTLKAEHIIVIDDGSDIKTQNILKRINIDEVEIVFQENKGVSNARNKGVSLAKTDYILNLDADDYFEPSFIEKAVEILNKDEEIGVVGCFYRRFKDNTVGEEIFKPLGGCIKDFIIKNNGLGTSMYRKLCWEKVSGYDEQMLKGYEDWEFWIAILRFGWKMHILPEVLFNYRIKPNSRDLTASIDSDFELRKYIFNKHKDVFEAHFDFYSLELLRRNSVLKNNVYKLKNSIEYKIGQRILAPLKFIKRKIDAQ